MEENSVNNAAAKNTAEIEMELKDLASIKNKVSLQQKKRWN